jgi:hypothetical protein
MTRLFVATSFLGVALASPLARAEATARDRAAAEAIFRQATALMDEERFAEACEKFSASEQLDPGLGTLLHLADCYDRAGRTASAWALFREVQDRSSRADQPDRERIAKERADSLESKLSKLELRVSTEQLVPGLQVRVAGSVIPAASLNTLLPVDPGATQIEISAPDKQAARVEVKVEPGPSQQVVELPTLVDAPRPKARPVTPGNRVAPPAPSSAQTTVGYIVAGAGLVALGIGGYIGYRAHNQNTESKAQCRDSDPNACTRKGFDQRQEAQSSAKLATIVTAGGAALSVAGLTLVLTAPSPKRQLASWQVEWRGEW